MATIEDDVRQILVEQYGEALEITPSSRLINDLGFDSLDVVEIIMAAEDKFEIEIPDNDAGKIRTVKDAVQYIEARLAAHRRRK